MQGRHRRRNRDESLKDSDSTEESPGEFSHQSGLCYSRVKSREFTE